jgi:hypothetical protein
VLRKT